MQPTPARDALFFQKVVADIGNSACVRYGVGKRTRLGKLADG